MREFHYDADHNFLWVDSVVGGTIPNNFLPAIEKGFKERLDRGVIAGYKIQNVCAEVYFGKHHPVDSSEAYSYDCFADRLDGCGIVLAEGAFAGLGKAYRRESSY